MEYRKFGDLGFDISTFGVGCMRLPLKARPDGSEDPSEIDEDEAIKILRYAMDNGVNYFDTAYPYHGGNSEPLLAKALKDGYREKVKIATKLPVWQTETYGDFERILDEQLLRLEVDYIDFYLLHALDEESWDKAKNLGVLDFLDGALESGKIRYPGFSFHDELPVFKDIINSYDWKMCQIQFNILDENYQAGLDGMHYAASKDIPVVVMEPLKGGRLAHSVPDDIAALWDEYPVSRSPVEWAFRWLYNFPEIVVILSGVSTMEQLKDNIRIFSDAKPNSMTRDEHDLVERVKKLYEEKIKVGCTACNYCMPCPSGVDIPKIFSIYNDYALFGELEKSKKRYKTLVDENKDATKCIECGQCQGECPQHIAIIEKLKEAHGVLAG